jgi:rRNA processing protein Gar1
MSESEIENDIKKNLFNYCPIRTTKLIENLRDQHPDKTGYSQPSIYRKIDELKRDGTILKISPEDYESYGINDSDKRAQYIILKEADERRLHLDETLNLLESGDQADAISVFNELDLYINRYPLNPKQLDKIIPVLYWNMEVAHRAVRILLDCVTRNRIAPSDKSGLLNAIKYVLENIKDDPDQHINIEGYCLEILGIWNDPYVIVQLTKDSENVERLKILKTYYESPYLSKTIEHERKRLFELERTLRKKNSDDKIMKRNQAVADIITDIRSRATSFVITPPPDASRYCFPEFN